MPTLPLLQAHRAAFHAVAAAVVALACGCAPKAPPQPAALAGARVGGPNAVDAGGPFQKPDLPPIVPGGSGALNTAFTARQEMAHPRPEWWERPPYVRRFFPLPALDRAVLAQDRERIRQWFVDLGFLDAQVELTLLPVDVRERWAIDAVYAAQFTVETGERWTIASVELLGTEVLSAELRQALSKALLTRDAPSEGMARRSTEAALARALSRRGYPTPTVTSVVVKDPQTQGPRTATLLFHVETGPPGTFGPLSFKSVGFVDADRFARKLDPPFSAGEPWDSDKVALLQDNLERLPAFSNVVMVPGVRQPDGSVPLLARVESPDRGGFSPLFLFASETSFWSTEVGGEWRELGLSNGLGRVQASVQGGYRILPTVFGPEAFFGNHGPVGGASLGGEWFVGPLTGVSLFADARGRFDTWRGYRETTAGAEAGVLLHPTAQWTVSAGGEVSRWWSRAHPGYDDLYTPFFGPSAGGVAGETRFRPQSWLLGPRLTVTHDSVDAPVSPTRGWLLDLSVAPRGWSDGEWWTRGELFARAYWPIVPGRVVLAPATRFGAMRWDDPAALQSIPTRFFAGGVNTVRGWQNRTLNPPGWSGGRNEVRIGGNVLWTGTLEGRIRVWPQLDALAFVDSGRVWERLEVGTPAGISLSTMQHSAGGGLQLPSPLGTLVAVYAHRLTADTAQEGDFPRGILHVALLQDL